MAHCISAQGQLKWVKNSLWRHQEKTPHTNQTFFFNRN